MNEQQIAGAEQNADLRDLDDDFLTIEMRQKCEDVVPHPENIPIEHIKTAFLHLKQEVTL